MLTLHMGLVPAKNQNQTPVNTKQQSPVVQTQTKAGVPVQRVIYTIRLSKAVKDRPSGNPSNRESGVRKFL